MMLDDVKTDWAKPDPLVDVNKMSQKEIQALLSYRSDVLVEITGYYKEFIEAIYRQPFHVVFRQHAFLNIDQGMHWVKAAVDNLWEIPVLKQEVPDAPEPEPIQS